MTDVIYLKELDCYINATDEEKRHPLMTPNGCFRLEKLPDTSIREEMELFIKSRGKSLSPLSIKSDIYPFNMMCAFLKDKYPDIQTFKELDIKEAESKYKGWLLKNGKSFTQKRLRTATGKTEITDSDLLRYLRKVFNYFNAEDERFCYESDIWYLKDIPIVLRDNPTKKARYINFTKIPQTNIRKEIKSIIYVNLSRKALGTVQAEMTAINRFTNYLQERYQEVNSLHEIDRELIEAYLAYTNTEVSGKKSYGKELHHLKTVLNTAAKVLEDDKLDSLFYIDDIGNEPVHLYRVYSDAEIVRLNAAIVEMDVQVARALMLHQLLGTRISETLTLKQDAIRKGETGKWLIRIEQIKTQRPYEKVINEDIKALFDKACSYTNEKYGKQKYVFVDEKDPANAMQYRRIQYMMMEMIRKNDLKDDNGERFGVGTHIFRHCYGKKLTEMHVDDVVIAKLLGHANTSSVRHYRRVSNETLCNETKQMRDMMDEVIKDLVTEWDE